jgi:RNA polymerase sigma-70 factor (ECF subfamily)
LSDAPTPEEIYQFQNINEILNYELNQIPPRYRVILTLFHLENLTYKEIADIMGLPEGTIKSHLFRGRKHIKDALISKYHLTDII